MAAFEIFTLVLSLILGLGIAQILTSAVHLVHCRRETTLSAVPFLWAAAIFLFHVNFLFAILDFYAPGRAFGWYLIDILSAVLLFVSGGLVLPSESRPVPDDLRTFFQNDGRLSLLPLGLYSAASIPWNVEAGLPLVDPNNQIHMILVVLTFIAFRWRARIRVLATVVFAGITFYAFLFVWARPGVPGG